MSALEGEHGDSILMALELERAGGEDAAISGLYGCAAVCGAGRTGFDGLTCMW